MFSFVNIFRVFDFLLSIDMKPVVELSFMPSLLATDPTEVGFWYRGGHSPPKDFNEWRSLISELTTALIDRYGLAEIKSWYFEVWNEPNCGFYDSESECCGPTCGNKTAYLDLFTNTFAAIKSVEKSLRVGGPATAQLGWLDTFLTGAVGAGATPDFLSSHLYPTDPHINHSRTGMNEAFEAAAALVKTTSATLKLDAPPPLLITEFNCGLGLECADAPYAASFIALQAIAAQSTTESIVFESYWTFSDIFEEQGQVPSEFSQAFGAQSINGVPKPVYRAMQLVKRLQPRRVAVAAPLSPPPALDGLVTTAEAAPPTTPGAAPTVRVEALVVNHVGGPPKVRSNFFCLRFISFVCSYRLFAHLFFWDR
jgi:xylan 1,4-beta-xylosidase